MTDFYPVKGCVVIFLSRSIWAVNRWNSEALVAVARELDCLNFASLLVRIRQ